MKKNSYTLYSWDTGDWYALTLNGKLIHEGDQIPHYIWLACLSKYGEISKENVIYDSKNFTPATFAEIKK